MIYTGRMSDVRCPMSLSDHETSDSGQRTPDIKKETL